MKHFIGMHLILVLLLSASTVFAGNVGLDINVRVGDQPRPVIVREPVYQQQAQDFAVAGDVQFIYPGALGFYVAVGLPYDLFYVQNSYYLFHGGHWNRSQYSGGPWVVIGSHELPPALRRHNIERIRHYRDEEYGVYRRDQEHYRGRHFRSGKDEWKEQRRDEKADRKYEKQMEKDERKQQKWDKHHD